MTAQSHLRAWWPVALVTLVALLPRFLTVLTMPGHTASDFGGTDADGYWNIAMNVLSGNGFSLDSEPPYRPDGLRTPLYPLLVVFVHVFISQLPRAVVILQAGLDTLTTLLVVFTTTRLHSRAAGVLAGLCYALTLSQWDYSSQLMTEVLLAFLLSALAWWAVAVRDPRRLAIGLGVLGGLAILCKPNVLPVLPIWVVALAVETRAFRQVLVGGLVVGGLVLAPWVARNWVTFGRPFVSSAFDNNIAWVSAVATLIVARGQTPGEDVPIFGDEWNAIYTTILARTEATYGFRFFTERTWSPPETDLHWRQVTQVATATLLEHPVDALHAHVVNLLATWWSPADSRSFYEVLTGSDWPWPDHAFADAPADLAQRHPGLALERLRMELVPLLADVLWIGSSLLWSLGAVALVLGVRPLYQRRPWFVAAVLLTMLYLFVLPGPIADQRFRVPFAPLESILQGVGLLAGWCWFRGIRTA